ncbi:MAG: AAA family ATPase [Lacipirellulaceae bacterium]
MSVESAIHSPNYWSFWGLERPPFASGLQPAFHHETAGLAEAEARLRFLASGTRQAALLLGERGSGKTLLVNRFAQTSRGQNRSVAVVDAAGLSPTELLWQTSSALAIGPGKHETQVALFRQLADFAFTHGTNPPTILIVDNADQAGPDLQTQLIRLMRLPAPANWLALVLVSETQAAGRLQASLLEAVDLQIDLENWTEEETIGYLQMALFEAGCDRPAFDQEALGALHALAEGIPRRVNRLAEQALIAGAAEQAEQVRVETIEAAFASLSFVAAN